MRTTILLSLLCTSTIGSAQNWCPPGADWIFGFYAQQAHGARRAWYSGDTIVGGFTAKRIDQTIHAYQPVFPFTVGFTSEGPELITREEGDLVLLWDNLSSSFDTLMWFGAEPGQHWRFPNSASGDRFNVLGTGTTVVEGIELRYLVVQDDILGWTDTLRERIGFDYFYLDPNESIIVDFTTDRLQCYRDIAISQYTGSMSSGICDFTLSATEPVRKDHLIAPNPGTDGFTVTLQGGPHSIIVHDAFGKTVLATNSVVGRAVVDAVAFAPGLYVVTVAGASGAPWSTRWLKQ